MSNESGMWTALRPYMMAERLDPVRVENPAHPGTPDVNYKEGWIELKHTNRWPIRDGQIQLPHPPTKEQIAWLYRRWIAGGICFLLIRVGSEWLLFEGLIVYALWKGPKTKQELTRHALRVFEHPRDVANFLAKYKRS
jgi:hypothetical protein